MTGHLITLGIQIVPKSASHDSYNLIDRAIDCIQQSGVKYKITPFETTVMEGKYEDLMMISESAQKAVLESGADEYLVYYHICYRKNQDVIFEEKS